jgi:hypothetical protein
MGEVNQVAGTTPGIKFVCDICCATIRQGDEHFADGKRICAGCAADPKNAVQRAVLTRPDPHAPDDREVRLAGALVAGGVGAVVAAAVWALIVVLTDYEIGYLAVGVGFLAGLGVKLGSGDSHGVHLQWAAVGATLFGMIAAKYFIYAHFFTSAAQAEAGISISYFSPVTLGAFPGMFVEMLSLFDALWVFLAVSTAWRIPATPPPPGAAAPPAT